MPCHAIEGCLHQFRNMNTRLSKWLFDYKLLHVFFWCLIGLFLYVTDYDTSYNNELYIGQSILVPLASCIPFYLTAYYFVPRFLYQKKYLQLIAGLLLLLILLVPCQILLIRFILHFVDNRLSVIPPKEDILYVYYMGVWNNLLCIFIGGGLKIMSDRFKLEKEKVRTELDFLRAQINPHFLFNMLNTIYFQIDKSNAPARSSIEKMSEMLRYQLYECVHDRIAIEREVQYIKNYVQMQSLRLEEGTDIRLEIDEALSGSYIAPLLIQPLIENAFKYISNHKEPSKNEIHIRLEHIQGRLQAQITNTENTSHKTALLMNSGGIGYKNLKRRLELLYPGNHLLTNKQEDNRFKVILVIGLYNASVRISNTAKNESADQFSLQS